jgi:hypothetical protein
VQFTPPTSDDLLDRLAILDLLARYARAVDTKDEALLASCHTTEMQCSGTAVGPMQQLFASRPGFDRGSAMTNTEFAAMVMASMRLKGATHHVITNAEFEFHGPDDATVRAYLRALHFTPERPTAAPYEVGGHYLHDVRRIEGAWRIAYWRLAITWEWGDWAVMSSAVPR